MGVGEASLPVNVPKEGLGTAMSVFCVRIFLRSSLTLLAGGMVVDALTGVPQITIPILGTLVSWRFTFVIVGLPGFLCGVSRTS